MMNNNLLSLEMPQQRNEKGQFMRIRQLFSLENFSDGYVDNRGRFKVWLPNHPRCYAEGYILRSIVAYGLYHNIKVPKDMDIHHKDEDRLNDSKENLVMVPHNAHQKEFHKVEDAWIEKICQNCGKSFKIERWRLKSPTRGQFCTQKCYHQKKRSETHRAHIGEGLRKAYAEGRRKVM